MSWDKPSNFGMIVLIYYSYILAMDLSFITIARVTQDDS